MTYRSLRQLLETVLQLSDLSTWVQRSGGLPYSDSAMNSNQDRDSPRLYLCRQRPNSIFPIEYACSFFLPIAHDLRLKGYKIVSNLNMLPNRECYCAEFSPILENLHIDIDATGYFYLRLTPAAIELWFKLYQQLTPPPSWSVPLAPSTLYALNSKSIPSAATLKLSPVAFLQYIYTRCNHLSILFSEPPKSELIPSPLPLQKLDSPLVWTHIGLQDALADDNIDIQQKFHYGYHFGESFYEWDKNISTLESSPKKNLPTIALKTLKELLLNHLSQKVPTSL